MQLYQKTAHDVNTRSYKATKQTVKEWEVTATDLLKRTEDSPPRHPRSSM